MTLYTATAQLLLLGLALAGFLSALKFADDNGLLEMLRSAVEAPVPVLPGSNTQLRTQWLGSKQLDSLLSSMVAFFAPVLDGSRPQLTLLGIHFYGQFVALWMLLVVEAYRIGNHWRVISFITFVGLLFENVALCFILPLWCALHLFTSPSVSMKQSATVRRAAILVHPAELKVLPWSILIGMGLPSALIPLTSPEILTPSVYSRQFWIAARQIHPFYTFVTHLLLSIVSSKPPAFASPEKRDQAVLVALRRVHRVASTIATLSHIAVVAILVVPPLVPSVSNVLPHIDPVAVWKPIPFWHEYRISSVAQGSQIFLQWDEIITCVTALVWAFTLNRHCLAGETGASSLFVTILRTIFHTAVGGPVTAVVNLIRERDEVLLSKDVLGKKGL